MKWLNKLLSNSDEASTNRMVGVFAFIVMVLIIIISLFLPLLNAVVFEISMKYLFYIIGSAFGLKGIEKVVQYITTKDKK
ncbi:hypothetical protein E9993_01585 [Labilibacter sediminis]|nr:hypothetical protein E9993_01585 [Labilibacter sediminis]